MVEEDIVFFTALLVLHQKCNLDKILDIKMLSFIAK